MEEPLGQDMIECDRLFADEIILPCSEPMYHIWEVIEISHRAYKKIFVHSNEIPTIDSFDYVVQCPGVTEGTVLFSKVV